MNRKVKAAALSVASNSILVTTKLIVGVLTGSVSIISEAAHSALDLVAAVIALLSVRASGRPADKEHPFGHGKIENLSGAIEAILIFVAAVWIIVEAIKKLIRGPEVDKVYLGVIVMGISVVANTLIARYLFKVAKDTDSIALEADAQHLSTDVWTSLGVLVGLAAIWVGDLLKLDWQILDPIVALGVAGLIIKVSLQLTRKAAAPLLDARLPDTEVEQLKEMVMQTPKIRGFHKLRTRKSGSGREIDYHLIVPAKMPIAEAHAIAENIEDKMRERFPQTHVVTHVEPDTADVTTEPGTEIRKRPIFRRFRQHPRTRRRPSQPAP